MAQTAFANDAPALSEEEYLALEKKCGIKYEFLDGRVSPISGATFNHRIVTANFYRHLGRLLRGRYSVGSADLRLKVETTGLLTYPDLFVISGSVTLVEPEAMVNPSLIAEVVDPRTELYDRTTKFEHYRQIPSLTSYLLVSQDTPRVEQFTRFNEVEWRYTWAYGPHDILDIPSLGITISLAEIYAGVEFIDAPAFGR